MQQFDANADGVNDLAFGFGTEVDAPSPFQGDLLCDVYFQGTTPCQGGVVLVDGRTGTQLWRKWLSHEVTGITCEQVINLSIQLLSYL